MKEHESRKGNGERSVPTSFSQPSESRGVRKRRSVHIRPSRFFYKIMSATNTVKETTVKGVGVREKGRVKGTWVETALSGKR